MSTKKIISCTYEIKGITLKEICQSLATVCADPMYLVIFEAKQEDGSGSWLELSIREVIHQLIGRTISFVGIDRTGQLFYCNYDYVRQIGTARTMP